MFISFFFSAREGGRGKEGGSVYEGSPGGGWGVGVCEKQVKNVANWRSNLEAAQIFAILRAF